MGSPAAAGRGGQRNFAKPEVDQEHLLDVFKKYVKLLGVQACFSFEPYGNLAKTSAVQAKGLSKASALLKQLHEVEGGLAFKYKDLKECLAKLSKDYPDLVLQAPLTKQSSWAGDKAEMLLILMAHARRLCNETRFKEACSKATQFEIKDLEELRAMLLPEVLPSPPKLQDAATHNTKSRDPDAKPCDEAAKEYASSCEQSAQETSDQGTGDSRNTQERQDQLEPGSRRQSPAGQQGSNQEVLGWRGFEEASCSRQACEKGQAEEEAGR